MMQWVQRLPERDQRTLRLGAMGVGAILALMVVVFPAQDQWDALVKRENEALGKLRAIESGVQDAASAVQALRTLRASATLHDSREALNDQTALMLRQVESLPGYRQITVSRLEGLPLRDEEEFFRSGVSLQFSGSLPDLHQFLKEARDAQPALKVERLSMMADQKNPSRVEGRMVISGYALVTQKGKRG